MKRPTRNSVAILAVSMAAVVSLWQHEGWTDKAIIPVKGDVPTVGPGLTKRPDGSPVRMGDTIKPLEGIARSFAHIQKDEAGIKKCVTAALTQNEYDTMVSFAYQYGVPTLCGSSIVREANAGNYAASCKAYKSYKLVRAAPGEKEGPGFLRGRNGVLYYDCSTPGNRRCPGVWTRSQERYNQCMQDAS